MVEVTRIGGIGRFPPGNLLVAEEASQGVNIPAFAASSATVTVYTEEPMRGYAALKCVSTGTSNYGFYAPGIGTSGQPVQPGTTYSVTVGLKAPSKTSANIVYIYWYQSNGTASAIKAYNLMNVPNMSSTEQVVSFAATAPADAAYAALRVVGTSSPGAGEEYHCSLVLALSGVVVSTPESVGETQLKDGAVAEEKIKDGAVTASKLAAETLIDLAVSEVSLVTGTTDTISMPGGTETVVLGAYQAKQHNTVVLGGHTVQAGSDDLGPIWIDLEGTTQLLCGNHSPALWRHAKGTLAVADIGKVWTNGSTLRTTLLDVDETYAWFSPIHNSDATLILSGSLTGTWACTTTGPDVTWASPTSVGQPLWLNRSISDTGINWSDGLVAGSLLRRVVQDTTSYCGYIQTQQASVGTKITAADAPSIGTYISEWRWPANQGRVTIVDVSYTAAVDQTIYKLSGLQMGAISTTVAVIGLKDTNPLSTWGVNYQQPIPNTERVDGVYPEAFLSKNAYGGHACGMLASSYDIDDAVDAGEISAASKLYPSATGRDANLPLLTGETITARGWRSYTDETSDRHVHVVTDPVTGITHWFLMAGSTGESANTTLLPFSGGRLIQTRGTATVEPYVGSGTITVTEAGWAVGTIT